MNAAGLSALKVNSNQRSNSLLCAKGLDNYMHPRNFGGNRLLCLSATEILRLFSTQTPM